MGTNSESGNPHARQHRKRILRRGLLAILVVAASLAFHGCVREHQYRTNFQPSPYVKGATNNESHAAIEVASNYSLAYVEFDDQGWLYPASRTQDQLQIDAVTNYIGRQLQTNGLLIVTFVHGWKHNAGNTDSNVVMFRTVLGRINKLERNLHTNSPAPQVMGVYVGWRGLAEDVEPFEELSFWSRKDAAERVGHGAVIELLAKLEKLRNDANRTHATNSDIPRTKMITIGHSFGGDIVYSATAPILTERLIESEDATGAPQPPRTLGDLVILINPAFEAARFETLWRLGLDTNLPPATNCVLAVFTSTADWATGLAFPAGRSVSTLFDTYQSHEQREANVDAVGHFAPFMNYDLRLTGNATNWSSHELTASNSLDFAESVGHINNNRDKRHYEWREFRDTNELTFDFSNSRLLPREDALRTDPIFNVSVDPRIIPDHDTIDRWVFMRFLSEFIATFASGGD
jgi:hypothetical protein